MLMDLCLVVVTILISVSSSPNAPRPTSPMLHHLIIVHPDVVFHLPNSRLYHNQIKANMPVSSATTLIDVFIVLVDGIFDQAVDVATMFTCTLFVVHHFMIVSM